MPRRLARLGGDPDAALAWLPSQRDHLGGHAGRPPPPGGDAARPAGGAARPASSWTERCASGCGWPCRRSSRRRSPMALASLFAALAAAEREPALRGPLHLLGEAMGVVSSATSRRSAGHRARPAARRWASGRAGSACSCPAMLKPRAAQARARLWAAVARRAHARAARAGAGVARRTARLAARFRRRDGLAGGRPCPAAPRRGRAAWPPSSRPRAGAGACRCRPASRRASPSAAAAAARRCCTRWACGCSRRSFWRPTNSARPRRR